MMCILFTFFLNIYNSLSAKKSDRVSHKRKLSINNKCYERNSADKIVRKIFCKSEKLDNNVRQVL